MHTSSMVLPCLAAFHVQSVHELGRHAYFRQDSSAIRPFHVQSVHKSEKHAYFRAGFAIFVRNLWQMAKERRHNDDLEIVYEDQWLIVVNKPSGLLTMAAGRGDGQRPASGRQDTAYSRVFDYAGRIFIVHRLDRDTSGLLVFAKDQDTKLALQENWDEAVLERKYVAILEGVIADEEGWIETWLYENPKSMKVHCYELSDKEYAERCKMLEAENAEGESIPAEATAKYPKSPRKDWQFAATHCKKLKEGMIDGKPYTMVEFELETGGKNQIRVHSQWIDHPIAGDRKYGAQTNPFGRLALHAQTLSFIHPWTGKTMKFTTRLPKPFRLL